MRKIEIGRDFEAYFLSTFLYRRRRPRRFFFFCPRRSRPFVALIFFRP